MNMLRRKVESGGCPRWCPSHLAGPARPYAVRFPFSVSAAPRRTPEICAFLLNEYTETHISK
jgi:hypothetical protein